MVATVDSYSSLEIFSGLQYKLTLRHLDVFGNHILKTIKKDVIFFSFLPFLETA